MAEACCRKWRSLQHLFNHTNKGGLMLERSPLKPSRPSIAAPAAASSTAKLCSAALPAPERGGGVMVPLRNVICLTLGRRKICEPYASSTRRRGEAKCAHGSES